MRALHMRLPVFIVVALAVALAGCKGNCRQLSEKLCECSINSVDRDACLRTASAAEASNGATSDQETACGNLLKPDDGGYGCDCRLLDTKQGKIRCGLARPGYPDN